MLGNKINEERGKTMGMRMLPGDDYRYLKMEITFQAQGTTYGVQTFNMGTYTVFERIPGQLYGEGQGILGSASGDSAIWKGHGVGRMTGKGMGTSFRYSLAFQAGKGTLEKLNGILVVGEHEVDENGNVHNQSWEWK